MLSGRTQHHIAHLDRSNNRNRFPRPTTFLWKPPRTLKLRVPVQQSSPRASPHLENR